MTQQQLIEKTIKLASIPSTVDNNPALRQAHDFLLKLVQKNTDGALTIEHFEQNGKPSFLAYRGPKRPEKFDILLNAHLDVVPAEPELFKPYIKGDKLYGRGVLDMKGTAVVMADVFSELVNKVPYSLALQVVTDEEVGGYDCVQIQLDAGVRANFVIVGEYSNEPHTIYNAARGLCWVELGFKGKMAHGGHPWHGKNAVVKASEFAQAILKYYPVPSRETWTTTASIAALTTQNTTYNRVPDEATLKIDFRFTNEDPTFQNKKSLLHFLRNIDPDVELLTLFAFEPALKVEELNPYVQGLAGALKAVTGVEPQFKSRPAGSDGRHFALVRNDVIEIGVRGLHQHSNNEYVELDSFSEYQKILRAFLTDPIPAGVAHTAQSRVVPQFANTKYRA